MQEARLIEDVLDVARIVNGDFKLEKKPVEVTQIVTRAVEGRVKDAAAKKIEVRADFAAPPCTAWVEPDRLQCAIESVISRAIDDAPAESAVRVWTRNPGAGEISIGVHHDGQVESAPAMFDPFERGAAPEAPAAWGLGLRLCIGKAVVEACGGSATVTSQGGAGAGTEVVLTLPTIV
jgi:K+-sensing histidine kinase KdpD